MSYITCKDLAVGYDGRSVASGLNFSIDKGDYLCIVGENGAGKSTLVKTLLGLLKPVSGEIKFGDDLTSHDIGYLPQQTPVQKDFPATVWEVALSGALTKCGARPFYDRKEKQLAQSQLERLGIWNIRRECYRHLSGGQQQRVLLARALCATENLLLLDEPVTGLDPVATAQFYQMIQQLNENGVAVIMISHDLRAIDCARHVLHMHHGGSFWGSRDEYKNSRYWDIISVEYEKGGGQSAAH